MAAVSWRSAREWLKKSWLFSVGVCRNEDVQSIYREKRTLKAQECRSIHHLVFEFENTLSIFT